MVALFQTTRKRPATVDTDTIVPMHLFDDNAINRSVLLYITLRFDNILDPDRLRQGLEKLMKLGNWRKLGARLRADDQGKLEYHIPAYFSEERPGFIFTHIRHSTSINDDPIASKIPRTTSNPAIYGDLDNLADLAHRSDGPKSLDDFLYSDEPQLSLHVVSFQDATLVSVSWLHTFMDALAMSAVLNAWVLVLNGQGSKVPPICNFDTDPLASAGTAPTEPHVLVKRQLNGFKMVQFSVRYVYDLVCFRDSQRTVFIPGHMIKRLKEAALDQLSADYSSEDQTINPPPFLTDSDILCAFLTRLAVANETPNSTREIGILNAFNLRPALASTALPPKAGVCLSNAVALVSAFATARDILTKPLAYTASLVRNCIIEQGTPAQVDALLALTRTSVKQTGRPPMFGEGGTRLVIFSNWTKAGFFNLDFGDAVVAGKRVEAKPSFVNCAGVSNGLSPRGSWPILGKEESGGYWVQGNLRSDLWAGVEKELLNMEGESNE